MKDWIARLYSRWLYHKRELRAIEIERQIREQLEQQYATANKALKDSLEIADQHIEVYRTRIAYQENIISELKAKQVLTQKPKRIQRRKTSRKGKRV